MTKIYRRGDVGARIGFVGSQPPFTVGQAIQATLTVRNPTIDVMDYVIQLSLGSASLGSVSVSVQPGATVTTSPFSGVAPAAGTWALTAAVTANGTALAALSLGSVVVQAVVVPPATPDITIVSVIWL